MFLLGLLPVSLKYRGQEPAYLIQLVFGKRIYPIYSKLPVLNQRAK